VAVHQREVAAAHEHAAGLGVAFIPELARQPDAGIAYVTPEEPIGRAIAVACRAGRPPWPR
jgi:hypothetical protein